MAPLPSVSRSIPVIGLLGGIASGKSLVAGQLQALGAVVLDGDRAGHEVLRLPEVEAAARDRWGDAIFGDDGRINRPALGRIVFAPGPAGERELAYLESLTHPRIGEMLIRQATEAAANPQVRALVLDAPVMLKANWSELCDIILFVDAPRQQRLVRAVARGWREEDFESREAAQESLGEKRKRADVVIDNSASPEATQAQVEQFWRSHVG